MTANADAYRAATAWEAEAQVARREIVAKGHIVTLSEFCTMLDVTPQAIHEAVQAHRLFALDVGPDLYYPAFFADSRFDQAKLEKVCRALAELGGWSKYLFFTEPTGQLNNKSPLDALRAGKLGPVLRAAESYVQN